MKMSEEMALRLHRMMWSDMRKELGDTPDASDRNRYKEMWCETHFPKEHILFNCFLCDYCGHDCSNKGCNRCPIEWPDGECSSPFGQPPVKTDYRFAPISEILALPARNKDLVAGYVVNDGAALARSYYEYREQLLSKASGIPATLAIDDHVKAIKEKAVEEYFANTPGAKLATMDVDQAFKQYADEQKAPIFRALAEASGLSAGNESVKAHISEIRSIAKQNGRLERSDELFKALSVYSGVEHGDWRLQDHVEAIQEKAVKETEPLKQMNDRLTKRHIEVKHSLAQESGLDHGRPVADHIKKIRDDAFSDGENAERERIQEKIEELLS